MIFFKIFVKCWMYTHSMTDIVTNLKFDKSANKLNVRRASITYYCCSDTMILYQHITGMN